MDCEKLIEEIGIETFYLLIKRKAVLKEWTGAYPSKMWIERIKDGKILWENFGWHYRPCLMGFEPYPQSERKKIDHIPNKFDGINMESSCYIVDKGYVPKKYKKLKSKHLLLYKKEKTKKR